MKAKQIERVAVETATQTVCHNIDSRDSPQRHCRQKKLHYETKCDDKRV